MAFVICELLLPLLVACRKTGVIEVVLSETTFDGPTNGDSTENWCETEGARGDI